MGHVAWGLAHRGQGMVSTGRQEARETGSPMRLVYQGGGSTVWGEEIGAWGKARDHETRRHLRGIGCQVRDREQGLYEGKGQGRGGGGGASCMDDTQKEMQERVWESKYCRLPEDTPTSTSSGKRQLT